MVLKVLWIKILLIKLTNSSKHFLMLSKTSIEVHLMHEFMLPKPFLVRVNEHAQSSTLGPKLMFLGGFMPFIRCTRPVAETGIEVHLIECLRIAGL